MITKAYFLFDGLYARYDASADGVDPGYPKRIGTEWNGFTAAGFASGIDSAVEWGNGKVYFFRGDQYLRYDINANRVDAGYPLSITDQWAGIGAAGFGSGIQAAVNWGNGKAYFFKGNQYLRYDIAADRVDDGFPLNIGDYWPGFAGLGFDSDIDAAVNWGNGKAYFFKGDQYLRYDMAADAIDGGTTSSIDSNGPGLGSARQGLAIDGTWTRTGTVLGSTDFSYLDDAFFSDLKTACVTLGCAPEDLLGVMESESAVEPWRQNPHGQATGLIQFMPATLVALGYVGGPDEFKQLTANQQLPWVRRFYTPYIGYLDSPGKLYQATFLPATLPGSNESTVIAAPGGPNADAYNQNRILDTNNDGQITVSDLTARVNAVRSGARWDALMVRLAGA
jgi:hypothetical protein